MDDTPLYCELFTITDQSRLSARLTSCMPSASNIGNGVFIKNVPTENKQWFGTQVLYSRTIKVKTMIMGKGCGHYVSLRNKDVKIQNKTSIITETPLPFLVYAILEQVILHFKIKLCFSRKKYLLSCYFDYVVCCQDMFSCKLPLTVCDKMLISLDKFDSIKKANSMYVIMEDIQLKLCDLVWAIKRKLKCDIRRVACLV